MVVVFLVTPHARNIARGLVKQPKVYFYDTGAVRDDPAVRFENAVACALLKRNQFLEDTEGYRLALPAIYCRTQARDSSRCRSSRHALTSQRVPP